ncbi:Mucin-associated surface protein (MASP) [Trypanosoma cruzi]|uniref:Mucin-associated surface protein (MASP), putative n=2 Tax=Trypanosoma cruzi TaxID=5693 RepID=Q4E201_TRYCC|nr:mucin-associated surface protein (MASP), putative [Trypanosoma cruzi]EAN98814.1 mucin-associated surface protein (MASP), putative [Trypanosoma cruzi]PWV15249.1 Mucin-associated surface protein (MASP) [Trypanosoma cruzi]|eukprot:XP_820665.1 mucin-associated surface protein (MASP) [Trypanosoma cruzi strain CL Brener]
MMMMTGRVLLVCALCVLWCGAGGGCEEVPGVSPSGVSGGIERERGDSEDSLRSEPPGAKKLAPETPPPKVQQQEVISPPPKVPPVGSEDGAGGDKEGKAGEEGAKDVGKENRGDATSKEVKKPENHPKSVKSPQSRENEGLQSPSLNGTHGVGTITSTSDSLTVNTNQQDLSSPLQPPLPNSSPHAIPSSTSAAGPDNEKSRENGNGTKNSQMPVVGEIQERNGTCVKAVASTSGEENSRLSAKRVEEMSDATKKDNSESSTTATAALRSDAGTEGTPTTNHPNQPSTEGATQPATTFDGEAASANKYDTVSQSAGYTTAPTTNAKTNDTARAGDSDGSTAVSHTTSPLLLLLVVACAAAAAVVAT